MKSKTGGGWLKSPSSEKKEDSGNRYVALFETWDRFSNAMGTEMANMVEEGQNKYGALNNQWLELYQKTANDMAKSMQNGDVAEIQVVANVWKNYNSRLLSQMNKIIEEWSNAQNTIQKTWQTYVPKIGEQLLKTTKGTNEDLRVDDLFKTWTDFSAHMGQDFLTLVDAIISDSQDVMGIWNELDNEMKGQIESTRALNQGVYTELNKNWTETSERMGAEINKFMKDYTQRYKELRITWLEYASTMVKQFVNVINVGSPDFEDMYKTYMDRTYQFLRMLNPSMMTTASLANEEIRELRKKVEELEKRIGNTRTD